MPIDTKRIAAATADPHQRMRDISDVEYAVGRVDDHAAVAGSRRRDAANAGALLGGLQDKRAQFRSQDTASLGSNAKKKYDIQSKKLDKDIATAQTAVSRADKVRDKADAKKNALRDLSSDWNTPDVKSARQEWGPSGAMHADNPVRALGAGKDVSAWQKRNEEAGRPLKHGEMLDVKRGWSDYVNQGWMQGGYDNNAAFRIHTPLSASSLDKHNDAVKQGTWNGYESHLKAEGKKAGPSKDNPLWKSDEQRPTWYAHELTNMAKHGYAIHTDDQGRQVAMPAAKADLLKDIKTNVPVIDP